ncbi:Uncharacterized protein TCM_043607 [Theobroma cacao]|uniref:Ubiquitin-like protease family profile domain-containing protein n=1 Tax=Theobroma cacao TaxID=3641 RepID=A0A061FPK8_THECC|nr:Uncharacterized protein TCM_043607 [Theobroma cacao]
MLGKCDTTVTWHRSELVRHHGGNLTGEVEKALFKRNDTTALATMLSMNEEIQRRQYEDFDSLLIVQREKWAFNVVINTHCKWSQLHYITKTLQQKGEYDAITESQSMDHELWFAIGKSKVQLSKQEFCLITGLKFGPMPDVFKRQYEVATDRIHARYWNGQESVKLQALLDTFYERRLGCCHWWRTSTLGMSSHGNSITLQYLQIRMGDTEMLEPTTDEALREYFVDLDVPLLESYEYMPIGHMKDRSDWGLGVRQKRISLKKKRASSGTKRMRTTTALVDELSGLKLMDEGDDHGQVGPCADSSRTTHRSSSVVEWKRSDVYGSDDRSSSTDRFVHHELGVDIDDDILGADGEHVTHVDDVVDEAVVVDVTLQSDDAEGEHVPLPESIFDASTGRDKEPDSVMHSDAVEIRSSSPESPIVHHGAAEISNPIERARLKMASQYMASPFVAPLVTRRDVREKIVEDYEVFKKDESARCNVSILGDQRAEFFTTLEDPNEEMTSEHIDACETIRMLHTEFLTEDARATMQVPDELRGYVEGERPTYDKKWKDVDFIIAPCNVGGHWVVAKIDLVRWTIKVVDSARTLNAKDNGVRAGQMTPLTTMMPFICHQASISTTYVRRDVI